MRHRDRTANNVSEEDLASIGQRITFLCFFLWVALVSWAL